MDDVSAFKVKQFLFSLAFLVCVYIIFRLFFFNERVVTIDIYNTKTNMESSNEQLTYTIEDEDGNILDKRLSCEKQTQLKPMVPIGTIGTYYVKQQHGTTPRVLYDETIYKVEIDAGWLFGASEIKIYKEDVLVDAIVFNNIYNATSTVAEIECYISQQMMLNNVYEFGLISEDNIIVDKAVANEEGKVIFKVPFTEEGTYKYKLRDITNKEDYLKDAHDFSVEVSCEILSRNFHISQTFYENGREIPKVVFGSPYDWKEQTLKIPMINVTNQKLIADDYLGQQIEIPIGESEFIYTSDVPLESDFYFKTENHMYELRIEFENHNNDILTTKFYFFKDNEFYEGDIFID